MSTKTSGDVEVIGQDVDARKELLSLMEQVFDLQQLQSKALYFNNSRVQATQKFVAWIDLMGTASIMARSLPVAANFIGKIHNAALLAQNQPGEGANTDISLHPINDGLFAISPDWNTVRSFTERVLRSLAYCFAKEKIHHHRFLVRAAISYGKIVDGTAMAKGNERVFREQEAYLHNMLVGNALALAHHAERLAPPYGIYVEPSVQAHSTADVSWSLHKWWNFNSDNDKKMARAFGSCVMNHLDWSYRHPTDIGYPVDKHQTYQQRVEEYFDLEGSRRNP